MIKKVATLPEALINLTPIQLRYYNDKHRFIVVSAGRRSRKTLIAKRKLLLYAIANPNSRLFHASPTRQQSKQIFWHKLKEDTKCFRLTRKSDISESDLVVKLDNGTEIHVVGLDKPQRIEGQPWNGCHITEFADVKSNAWSENIRPVLADTRGFAILDGVPDKSKIEHKKLSQFACGGAIERTYAKIGAFGTNAKYSEWCYYSWFSSDVLDKKEIEELKEITDPSIYRQEYEGSYESLTGLPYYAYSKDNIDDSIKYDPALPIIMGFDFNVDPMTAVLGHVVKEDDKQIYKLFKGYYLRDANTSVLCDRILSEHPESKVFFLTPCQSSINRQTVADLGITDLRIIKNKFDEHDKHLRISKRSKNPKIIDRINATNSLLHHNRIKINSKDPGLKKLIIDFEEITWKTGTSDLDITGDKYKKMLGHISAALDYVVEYHWSIKRKHINADTKFNNFII